LRFCEDWRTARVRVPIKTEFKAPRPESISCQDQLSIGVLTRTEFFPMNSWWASHHSQKELVLMIVAESAAGLKRFIACSSEEPIFDKLLELRRTGLQLSAGGVAGGGATQERNAGSGLAGRMVHDVSLTPFVRGFLRCTPSSPGHPAALI
jgi:hypothetical protein